MKTACLLALGLLMGAGLSAQITISGEVKGGGFMLPLPATVYSSPSFTGATCDSNGRFTLNFDDADWGDTLVFSAVGYISQRLAIVDVPHQRLQIVLIPDTQLLPQVRISSTLADSLVHEAFKAIAHNYPQQPVVYPALYRQVHMENEQYVRLIEAALEVREPAYANRPFWKDYTGVHVFEMRRSEVFEANGDQHGDHLMDLLGDDPILYYKGTFLNPSAGKDVLFWMDTSHVDVTDSVVVVGYQCHTPGDSRVEDGKIFIHQPDMAIVRVESNRHRNKNIALASSASGHEWDLQQGGRVVQFIKRGGVYCLDSMEMWYTHNVCEHDFPSKAWRVTEQFSLWADRPNGDTTQSFSQFGNLYGRHYRYDPVFWQQFSIYQHHPCDATVLYQLNHHRHTLEEQFEREGEW